MTRGVVLIFAAVVSVIYGLGLLFAPAMVGEMHGIASSAGTSLMARYFGGALVGVGIMSWLAREADDSDALSALLKGSFVISGTGLLVGLHGVFTGVMNAFGWIPVAIGVLLTIGFGIHAFARR